MNQRNILMTSALTYANGELHLGHMIEAIQADIWARFQRLQGHQCTYVFGSDTHGTAIMIYAEKEGITPEQLIERIHKEHKQGYSDFLISFDNFYTTHSQENQNLSNDIFNKLNARGDIETRTIKQAFDPDKQLFLADRFIKCTCPYCGATDQYGDNCENCGKTYEPMDAKDPKSAISGATPVEKESEHLFFKLENYSNMLQDWTQQGHLQQQISNKLNEWFEDGLKSWDISRDAPYFGFEIPEHPGKYFYVWMDAPVGYMASFQNLCKQHDDLDFNAYWNADSKHELYHFIGKDIVYFHALFWPAMLSGANYRTPTAIFVHGFLTINGKKMSKSRGTFITARQYLDHLAPEYLRYYFAAKLSDEIEDIDLNLEDFKLRVNSDLVGKYVNLASRCAGFISKKFDGMLADALDDTNLFTDFITKGDEITEQYDALQYSRAVRNIMELADAANQYIDAKKPWSMAKEEGKALDVQAVCTQGLNLFKVISTYLKPILPETVAKVESFLQCEPLTWQNRHTPLLKHKIAKFKPLMQRITDEDIEKILEQ